MRGKSMAATTVAMQRGNCAATTAMRHSSCMATSVARARQPAWQPAWCRAVAAQVAMQLPGRAATVARQWPRCTAVVVAIGTAIARHEHGKRRAQHGKSMTIMDHGCLFARSPGVEARRRGATDNLFRGILPPAADLQTVVVSPRRRGTGGTGCICGCCSLRDK